MSFNINKRKRDGRLTEQLQYGLILFFLLLHTGSGGIAQAASGSQDPEMGFRQTGRSVSAWSDPGALCTNPIVFSQVAVLTNGAPSQNFETFNNPFDVEAAEDFVLPVASAVSSISVVGMGMAPDSFVVRIYRDGGGMPGSLVYTQLYVDPAFTVSPNLDLSACPVLSAGTYWISVQAVANLALYGQWFWTTASDGQNQPWHIRNPNGGFGTACNTWGDGAGCSFAAGSGPGLAFSLNTCVANVLSDIGPNCRNVNASVDINGNTFFSLSDVVTNFPAAAPARVTITRVTGYPVFGPATVYTGNIVLNACALLDETLTITVETEGGACWSNLTFKQLNGPVIESRNSTVYCLDKIVKKPDLSNAPTAYLPCQAPFAATYVTDWLIPYDCEPGIQDTVKVILREWEAYDKLGRRGVAYDTIVVLQLGEIDANHIYCEAKDTLYCSDTTERIGPFITYEGVDLTCDTFWLVNTADVDNDGMLEFHPAVFDSKCGINVYLDSYKVKGECGNVYRVKVEMKQSCYGPADQTCFVFPPAGTASNQAVQVAPGYWRCEFWLYDLDTVKPEMYCKAVELLSGPFDIGNWQVIANPKQEVASGNFFDPEHTIQLDALPYQLKIKSYFEDPAMIPTLDQRNPESALPPMDAYSQNFEMNYEATEDLNFDFGWTFNIDPLNIMTNMINEVALNQFYTSLIYSISVNGIEYPVLEEGDVVPVKTQRSVDPVLLFGSREGVLSIPLKAGDSFSLRANWISPTDATLTLYGPNIVSTTEHECAAYSYIPSLFVKDDWSGVKQVKAIVESAGTFIMSYDSEDSCWVSHEKVKLPKNGEYYKVIYEAYDSCHNQATDSCFIYVKDRIKPVPVMDKSVTVSLSDKKVWLNTEAFDEGSYDNCDVNLILIRRADWQESCIDLCDSVSHCFINDHQDTLWVANLTPDKTKNEVEAHYAKTLQWLCEDDTPCGELVYNAWLYDLMKYATLHCNPHLYGAEEAYFKEKFAEAYYSSASFRNKFDRCQPEDPNQTTEQRFSPFRPDFGNVVDLYEQLGGGWSDAVAFDCADACQFVTIEMLVMDYWCNWTKIWNEVRVEDKNPPQVVKEVKDYESISCKSYHDYKYDFPGERQPVNIDFIVEKAKENNQDAFNLLDDIFGGYRKAWRGDYGNYVDGQGQEIPVDIPFIDSVCYCTDEKEQIYVYDDHLGYFWKDSIVTNCYYDPDTNYFRNGIILVNCQENVQCKQEVWCEFDHCGQGYLYRKFKIWQSCSDSFYTHDLLTDSVFHPIDTIERIQRVFVGNECELNKYMFDVPGDLTIETCGISYDDQGNVVGDAGPENTGMATYKFAEECRIVGIAHKDKVFKIVGGEEACYKIFRTWYFADWCGTGSAPINKNWWEDYTLVLDSCVQKILVIDKIPPICEIKGPVANGDTVEMGGCNYKLQVKVNATDVCGLTNYHWELRNISNGDNSFIQDGGDDILTGDEEEFNISAPGLLPGDYKLRVHLQDECNNENYCEYYFSIKAVKKPTPVCYSSLTVRLTPWDRNQDGQVDTALALVWASEFDRSSTPTCGDDSVQYRVEIVDGINDETAAGDSDFLELGCEHIGTQLIRLWVISLPSGSMDYCDVVLIVQSDFTGCGPISTDKELSLEISEKIEKLKASSTHIVSGNPAAEDDFLRGQWEPLQKELDQVYLLEQNAPNPFRSETSIGFVLPKDIEASLLIYDTNGRLVKEYSAQYKKGYNQIGISRSELGHSSVLFYRLQTEDGFSEIRRMIILE